MRKFKRLTLTLALLLTAVGGAWADETPLLTIESKDYTSFTSGSKTFDDKVTVTFSNSVSNDGDHWGWYTDGTASLLTVAGINGYTITSCKFYTGYGYAQTGYPVEGESPSVYLYGGFVFNDASQSVTLGYEGVTKIEVYGTAPAAEPTEWSLTPDETGKTWTLAKMPASNVELQVEYEPTKVTMAVNDNAMGTVEVAGQSIVEWTADTWKGWTADIKEYTVDDITMTSSQSAHIREYISEDKYNNSLFFFVRKQVNDATVTFSTTGDPFSRIEFTMIGDYSQYNPDIIPNDNWTFEGKSAVWEGEATKSLTLQSCSTNVSKIKFYKGFAIPAGVTVNSDGTFTVAKTATVTLKATPAEGYKFLYWEDDQTNTNPVREVTIESGMADKTYKAVFAEILYNVTFVEGTNLDEWTATPATEVKKDAKVDIKYTGAKKVIGVKVEEKKGEAASSQLSAVTTDDIGKVVCAAGHLHDAKTAVPDGCTAVGILGKVTETGHGLILALKDATAQTWNTIDGWTSASYAGTTLKVLPDDAARGTNLTSYTTLGGTTVSNWAVAQQSDYDAIFTNLGSTTGDSYGTTYDGNVNAYITTGVGGSAISGHNWSATEDSEDANYACDFESEYWNGIVKTASLSVRPVLAF